MSLPMADNERGVFIAISDIELKKETMYEFKVWFSESNKIVSRFDGFMSRRLLESPDGKHRIMVIFRDKESFARMHQTQEHSTIHAQAVKFMMRPPMPTFYSVVAE